MSDHGNNNDTTRSNANRPNRQPDKPLKRRERVQRAAHNEGEHDLASTSFGQAGAEALPHQATLPQAGVNTHHLLRPTSLSTPGVVQPKMEVTPSNDIYEQEADRVADEVMRMPGDLSWVGQKAPVQPRLQLKYQAGEQQQKIVARLAETDTPEVTEKVESNINKMKDGGQPLPDDTRSFFEQRMGADFSDVRVHTDSNAIQTSRDVKARAFTVGNNIAFNSGEYNPGTGAGKRLLAHELTHTIQQGAAKPLQRHSEPAGGVCPTCGGQGAGTCSDCGPGPDEDVIALQAEEPATSAASPQEIEAEFEHLKKEASEKFGKGDAQNPEGAAAMESEKEHLMARAETAIEEKGATAPPDVQAKLGGLLNKAEGLWGKVRNEKPEDTAEAAAEAQALAQAPIRFKANTGGANAASPQMVQRRLGRGQSLHSGTRTLMERAFGRSFSDVRVHTDAAAVQLSRQLNARAFAVGQDIAFDTGEYRPGTIVGDALIAHELAHVSQQSGATARQPQTKGSENETAIEQDADNSAVKAMLSIWSGGKLGAESIAREAMPRLQTGLGLRRCNGSSNCSTTVPSTRKSLTVHVTQFDGGPSIPTSKITEVYDKANIEVNTIAETPRTEAETTSILGADKILDASPSGATLTSEENAMLAHNTHAGTVTAYHIPDNDRGVLGHSYGSRGHNAFFYSSNNPRTWPHELGHVLGLGHENDSPDNIMAQTSVASGVDCWTDDQINTLRGHALVS